MDSFVYSPITVYAPVYTGAYSDKVSYVTSSSPKVTRRQLPVPEGESGSDCCEESYPRIIHSPYASDPAELRPSWTNRPEGFRWRDVTRRDAFRVAGVLLVVVALALAGSVR